MKKLIAIAVLVALCVVVYKYLPQPQSSGLVGGSDYQYLAPTQATSSVGITNWTSVLSADSSRGYVALCNNSITASDAIYLGFGATSTKPYGYRLPSGECYEMTLDKMYYGTIYAIASTATTTLLEVYK